MTQHYCKARRCLLKLLSWRARRKEIFQGLMDTSHLQNNVLGCVAFASPFSSCSPVR